MVKSKKETKTDKKALAIKHPNSRKALKLAKQLSRQATRNRSKVNSVLKRNILGERLIWFQELISCEPETGVYTPDFFARMIESYLDRNDEELEQIRLKHSIGQRKNRQHASREDAIVMTKERETEEYHGPGLEMVNIMKPKMLEQFRNWDGKFGSIGLLKVERFSKKTLENYKQPQEMVDKLEQQRIEVNRWGVEGESVYSSEVDSSDAEDHLSEGDFVHL